MNKVQCLLFFCLTIAIGHINAQSSTRDSMMNKQKSMQRDSGRMNNTNWQRDSIRRSNRNMTNQNRNGQKNRKDQDSIWMNYSNRNTDSMLRSNRNMSNQNRNMNGQNNRNGQDSIWMNHSNRNTDSMMRSERNMTNQNRNMNGQNNRNGQDSSWINNSNRNTDTMMRSNRNMSNQSENMNGQNNRNGQDSGWINNSNMNTDSIRRNKHSYQKNRGGKYNMNGSDTGSYSNTGKYTPDVNNWPDASRKAVEEITKKYGSPDFANDAELVWMNKGVWNKICITKNESKHSFPIEHTDNMTTTINYKVPVEKMDDLGRFDGSVTFDRTQGTLSARCDKEANNILALNLANDIIKGTKTVDQARKAYGDIVKSKMNGADPAYMKKLTFLASTKSSDPDINTTGLTKDDVSKGIKKNEKNKLK